MPTTRAQPERIELGIGLGGRGEPRDVRDRRRNRLLDPRPGARRNAVGISPTQELVSRDGMIQARHQHARRADLPHGRGRGARSRAYRRLRSEGRAHGLQRRPQAPAAVCDASPTRSSSTGLRIGVVREYMDKSLFTKTDQQTIDLVDAASATSRSSARRSSIPAPARLSVRRLPAEIRPAARQQAVHAAVSRTFFRRRRRQAERRPHRDARRDGRGPRRSCPSSSRCGLCRAARRRARATS